MPLRLLPIAFAAPLLLVAASAMAEPKTIDDCEAIQAADAYNQCLALFGPVAHEHALSPEPVGTSRHAAETETPTQGKSVHVAQASRGHGHAIRVAHGHSHGGSQRVASGHQKVHGAVHVASSGRKRMQFSVNPGRSRIQ